ncbi:CUB and sushi domain-containing protein 3-like [Branchiostoma lanceolatum]|uniref:CUB and sushi domain-containing protein 3-like n=1 Tax=Branchiostoma lanceolatum TaxID=7740 RepID=UPI003456EF63
MNEISQELCGTSASNCAQVHGVYQFMNNWGADDACGAESGSYCVPGSGQHDRYALCAREGNLCGDILRHEPEEVDQHTGYRIPDGWTMCYIDGSDTEYYNIPCRDLLNGIADGNATLLLAAGGNFGCWHGFTGVACPLLSAPDNGGKTGDHYYHDEVTFTCDLGYELMGSSSLTCQADSTWSGGVPSCTPPTNGGVSGPNSYGDTVSFTCNTGYTLIGPTTLTCQANLAWTGSPPTCSIVQCPLPTSPDNGGNNGNRDYQAVMTFWCDLGYDLVGSSNLTCQADATWSGNVPTCTIVQCPMPASPTNGAVSGSNSYGDVLSFTCDPGYTMTVGQCPILTSPTNGGVSGPNSYGDTVSFTCNTGYTLIGPTTLTCQANLAWTGSPPTCSIVQCPLPTSPDNGGNNGNRDYQAVMTFWCDLGYDLVGSSNLTCQADATWSGDVPTCTIVQCPMPVSPTNGAVSGSNSYGDVLSFTCDPGYTMAVGQCSILTAPTNGGVSGSNSYGDTVSFTCNIGYNLLGPTTLTCQSNLAWSGSPPTCSIVQCPPLAAPDNGGKTGDHYYQDVVTFTCDLGYDLVGSSSLTCQADSAWSGSVPTCTIVQCPILASQTNGVVSGSNSYGDVLTFTCDPGYTLDGATSLTCQADRTWSASQPTCNIGQCSTLTAPLNGVVIGSNTYGAALIFTCNIGYILIGSSSLTCQSNLVWSGNPPTCSIVQCPLLNAPDNGGKTGDHLYQDIVTFTCDPGYDLIGSSSLTCQADSTWSGSAPTCTRVQCPLLQSPTNGGSIGNNYYQDVKNFTCGSGYELDGLATITCQADGKWSGSVPSCARKI